MREVLVRVGRAGRLWKVAFERRPSSLHEKPAHDELNVSEKKFKASQLIGEPKVSEAHMMKWRGEHLPQHVHEPTTRRAVRARHRLYEIDEEEGDESERIYVVLHRIVGADHEGDGADEPEYA